MANNIRFEDYSGECKNTIRQIAIQWLHECGQILISQILDIYRVDTGNTKNSFDYIVDDGDLSCMIGSPMENAIWEEFGTGIHAENGNGRKTGWVYTDRHGRRHWTRGKKGTKAFRRSFDAKRQTMQSRLEDLMGELK